jgi:hypothetical protein|tara:strand:+ start:52 stop:522 length:471 start_codon:yes stop_codon:yes gene_type:complete
MLEMLVIANSAFAVIKQTLENGKELASAGNAISRFVSAEDKLQQDLHKKRNSIWTNLLGRTDNDLEEFMALEQIRVKNEKLREYMQLYGRAGLWTDYQQYCAEARKQRKEARIKAEKRKQQIKDTILKVILVILITALLSGVVTVLAIIARKKGII